MMAEESECQVHCVDDSSGEDPIAVDQSGFIGLEDGGFESEGC